jgi:hypothetical protein
MKNKKRKVILCRNTSEKKPNKFEYYDNKAIFAARKKNCTD